jgi:hypothetical protein
MGNLPVLAKASIEIAADHGNRKRKGPRQEMIQSGNGWYQTGVPVVAVNRGRFDAGINGASHIKKAFSVSQPRAFLRDKAIGYISASPFSVKTILMSHSGKSC